MSAYLSRLYAGAPVPGAEGRRQGRGQPPARALPRRRQARQGHAEAHDRGRHAVRGAGLLLHRPDRRARPGPAAAGPAHRQGAGRRADADPCRSPRKGKGYAPAERAADKGHATSKFDVCHRRTGARPRSNAPILHQGLRQGSAGPRPRPTRAIVAVTAAMPDGTGPEPVRRTLPHSLLRRGHRRTARRDLLRPGSPPAG